MRVCLLLLMGILLAPGLNAQNEEKPMSEMNWTELVDKWEALATANKNTEALPYARAAMEIARRDSGEASLAYGNNLDFLGYSLHHSGALSEAETCFKAAVAHGLKHLGEANEDYITRVSNLAMLHLTMGKLAQCTSELEYAVELGAKYMGNDNPDYGILLNNLGLAYENAGNSQRALKNYLRALDITERTLGKDHPRYGYRLINIAAIYRNLGQIDKALECNRIATEIAVKTVGKNNLSYLYALNNLLNIDLVAEKFDNALSVADTMLVISSRLGLESNAVYYELAEPILNTYFYTGQYARTATLGRQLLQRFEPIVPNSYLRHLRYAHYIAASLEKMGKMEEALDFFQQESHFTLKELRESFSQFSEEEQLTAYKNNDQWWQNGTQIAAFRHPELSVLSAAAFDYQMNVKGVSLSNRNQLIRALRESPKSSDISTQFENWQQLQALLSRLSSLPPAKRPAQYDSLSARSNELERALAQETSIFRLARQTAHWQELQKTLPQGAVAIEFGRIPLSDKILKIRNDSIVYCAWILHAGDKAPQQVFLFEEKELRQLNATRKLYAPQAPADGKNLRQLIWQPLEAQLAGVSTIYFAPAGILNLVNLGAIPISETEVLGDRFTIHRLFSTRTLLENPAPDNSRPSSALVFGGIRYDKEKPAETSKMESDTNTASAVNEMRGADLGSDWTYLESSFQEADEARKYLEQSGARVIFADGWKASEDLLKKTASQSPSPTLLHLATHGFFQTVADSTANIGFAASENPMVRAGLVLAGANAAWHGYIPPEGEEDGILTALEISNLDLSQTQLAVLSACGSGQGQTQVGEGVLGLQRGFKIAGVHYVLMTLWSVNDRHAQEFMSYFYHAWLVDKQDIPQAFHTAQKNMRQQYSRPFQPGAWAGFVLLE